MERNKASKWNRAYVFDRSASPLDWEEMPGADSLRTIATIWHASIGQYDCRIDRFPTTIEAGVGVAGTIECDGYAYTIECDGRPLRGAENEPAFSWESAHDCIVALLRREGAL